MFLKYCFPVLLSLFAFGITKGQTRLVASNHLSIVYEGRVKFIPDAAELSWPGTSVYIQFKGTEISAVLKDADTANYYNVIVDDKVIAKIHTDTVKRTYLLATNLSDGPHKVQLFKRTEWDKGKTWFYGFETPAKSEVLPAPTPKKRKIEFFGNSITCGYAIEDSSGKDSWHGYHENNYLTYAAITARHFNAQYHCTSKSGIGILVSWFPLLMPEMYNRLDPADSASRWDFSKYTPDIVVINLFQNDSWLVNMPNHEQFKYRFGTTRPTEAQIVEAYRKFVATIRNTYPKAAIICALGSMDATREGSPWPGYVQQAVSQLNDARIYTHFFKYKNTGGHPNLAEQKLMADDLIAFIEKTMHW